MASSFEAYFGHLLPWNVFELKIRINASDLQCHEPWKFTQLFLHQGHNSSLNAARLSEKHLCLIQSLAETEDPAHASCSCG